MGHSREFLKAVYFFTCLFKGTEDFIILLKRDKMNFGNGAKVSTDSIHTDLMPGFRNSEGTQIIVNKNIYPRNIEEIRHSLKINSLKMKVNKIAQR